jgi:uncharacterized protein YraI
MALLMVSTMIFLVAPVAIVHAAPTEQTIVGCTEYHTVQRGETLYRIARRYGTTYQALQRLNNLPDANRIRVGQRLCVQANATTSDAPVVQPTSQQFIMALQTVRIRTGPGTQYAVIGSLFEGMTAQVTGISSDDRWWRVICPDGTQGSCWVSADQSLTRPIEVPNQVNEATVNSISVEVRESNPVQVVATVFGHLADGCVYINTFRQFRQGNSFLIEYTTGRNPGMCTQALTSFEFSVTLDTVDLASGHYFVAADKVQTSFVLSQ